MAVTQHNPPDVFPPYAFYAHAVEVPAGARTLYVSGLNGFESDGVTMPPRFEEPAEMIWQHLARLFGALSSDSAAGCPRPRRHGERRLRQHGLAALAELRPLRLVEPGEKGTGGADAERVGLPPVVERGVLHADRELGVLDLGEAGVAEQLGEVTLAGARPTRLVVDVEPLGAHRRP